jgi:monoamine oxidase
MEGDWEVIILGAGMAGIGASSLLTKQKVPHLMLESRDRVGGRVFSSQFDGVTIEEGPVSSTRLTLKVTQDVLSEPESCMQWH